jgi:hypothetical protein
MSMQDYNFNKARQAWSQPGTIIYTEKEMYASQPQTDSQQDTPINAEMNMVGHNLIALHDYILELELRLSPVLRPADTQEVPLSPKEARGTSPMVNGLRDFNSRLRSMRDKVCELRDRLEV